MKVFKVVACRGDHFVSCITGRDYPENHWSVLRYELKKRTTPNCWFIMTFPTFADAEEFMTYCHAPHYGPWAILSGTAKKITKKRVSNVIFYAGCLPSPDKFIALMFDPRYKDERAPAPERTILVEAFTPHRVEYTMATS